MRPGKAPLAVAAAALTLSGGGIAAFAQSDQDDRAPSVARAAAHARARPSASGGAGACGAAAQAVVADLDGQVAVRIYSGELSGAEAKEDRSQITGYGPLRSALSEGRTAAVAGAVHDLVFSHTHIVRLRITQGHRLLSDIGGPYILAPVTGAIRDRGRTLARFSFSVQDDLGYIKLVTRFVGIPLVLRSAQGQVPVAGQAAGAPARIPSRGPVAWRGASFQAFSFDARAYPAGPLRISLLSPPRTGLASASCGQVRATESARIAARISRRFALAPANLQTYVRLVHQLTLAKVFLRVAGRTYTAGARSMPRHLPVSGAVSYGGLLHHLATLRLATSAGSATEWLLVPG